GERKAPGPDRAKAVRVEFELEEGTMPATSIAENKSPELLKVVERAKDPKFTFLALAHLLDEAALTRAYHRLRADAAVGIAGHTKEQYGQGVERNISSPHERRRTKRGRHPANRPNH